MPTSEATPIWEIPLPPSCKCIHGVYIGTEDKGLKIGPNIAEFCTICRSIHPELDPIFGKSSDISAYPSSVDGAYGLWIKNNSEYTLQVLFNSLRRFSIAIATQRFKNNKSVNNSWYDVAEDMVPHILEIIHSYEGAKSLFSTWAHTIIDNELIDWYRDIDNSIVSIDDKSKHIELESTDSGIEERILLKEIKHILTDEEVRLFEMRADKTPYREIAEVMKVSRLTAMNRWKKLEEKIKNLINL